MYRVCRVCAEGFWRNPMNYHRMSINIDRTWRSRHRRRCKSTFLLGTSTVSFSVRRIHRDIPNHDWFIRVNMLREKNQLFVLHTFRARIRSTLVLVQFIEYRLIPPTHQCRRDTPIAQCCRRSAIRSVFDRRSPFVIAVEHRHYRLTIRNPYFRLTSMPSNSTAVNFDLRSSLIANMSITSGWNSISNSTTPMIFKSSSTIRI